MITVSYKNTNPAYLKNNVKAWVEYVECEKTDKCPLYKDGKCACYRYLLGKNQTCPNGKWVRKEGFTKRANSFFRFAKEVEKNYAPTATEYKEKIALVAGYVFIPLPYLEGQYKDFDGVVNGHFIPQEEFNEDMIERLVSFVPRSWIGMNPIREYEQRYLPIFILQLKEEMPLLYELWAKKYPYTAKDYGDIKPIGRTAYVSTLPDGVLSGGWEKKGDVLINNTYKNILFSGSFGSKKETRVVVDIQDDMKVKIDENISVCADTKYVD